MARPARTRCLVPELLTLCVTLGLAVRDLPGQAPEVAENDKERVLSRMVEFLEFVKVAELAEGRPAAAELIQTPLLYFADSERNHRNGSVWAWGRTGRPAAIIEVYTGDDEESWPGNVMHSLSAHPLSAEARYGWRWTPDRPGVGLADAPDAPRPAAEARARLRQMKELSKRFSASEVWGPDDQRSELRLLTQPVHRYADPEAGLLDGALFVFAHGGTNPEAVLLIEARVAESGEAKWRFGFGRLGHAGMRAELDGTEVWHEPRLGGIPSYKSPYYCVVAGP